MYHSFVCHTKTKPHSSNTGTASACNPIESFGTGVISSTAAQVSGCGQNQVLLAGDSCAVQCDTSDGYSSGYGLFTCSGNTDASSNLTCSRTCYLEVNVQDKFGARGGNCVPGSELIENQQCSFEECEPGKIWSGVADGDSFSVKCKVNGDNVPVLEAQDWECTTIPAVVDDAGTAVVATTGVVGGSSALSLIFGFQVAFPLQLLVAIIIDSMQFFVALSVLGGRTSAIHRHLADTFGVVLMNETTALGPMFTALNAPIDEMNQTLTNRTMYDVKFWSCKEDFRGLDFSSLSQNDRVTRDLVRRRRFSYFPRVFSSKIKHTHTLKTNRHVYKQVSCGS